MPSDSKTGVSVNLAFMPLAFILFMCTPRVEIDGKVHKRAWGRHFFPLDPGKHKIEIYFPYLIMPKCGGNSIKVEVEEGHVTKISYYMWPWVFAKGSLKIEG